jgi:hypothetical protein
MFSQHLIYLLEKEFCKTDHNTKPFCDCNSHRWIPLYYSTGVVCTDVEKIYDPSDTGTATWRPKVSCIEWRTSWIRCGPEVTVPVGCGDMLLGDCWRVERSGCCLEMSDTNHPATRRHITEEWRHLQHQCESLKSGGCRPCAIPVSVLRAQGMCSRISQGKAVPLQAWIGPEGSSRLRPPDCNTVGTLRW